MANQEEEEEEEEEEHFPHTSHLPHQHIVSALQEFRGDSTSPHPLLSENGEETSDEGVKDSESTDSGLTMKIDKGVPRAEDNGNISKPNETKEDTELCLELSQHEKDCLKHRTSI